ncbi:UPF0481 protein At3g47200-like [Vicia villosa]|uniref:UPF0481 protein At3g47200-like n=1 Tax=Vicia villosa TaxID=3911 RepID=UPI00273AF4AA|nr:UPF0481 protein At3g47200-like [Vicia villosa]XP_058772237.1 UPF0481 protein At3g47200-like [Vicia villosa]
MEANPNGYVSQLKNELKGARPGEFFGFHKPSSIYKVPHRIRQTDPEAYTPRVISIGPFHKPNGSSGDNVVHQMEKLKLIYLREFLDRTKLSLDNFVFQSQDNESWENRIRSRYAGSISLNSDDFLKIIIIDACFIIEHFLRVYDCEKWIEYGDSILQHSWLLSDIKRDLALLENQLPFFVLEDIYKLTRLPHSVLTISTHYFLPIDPKVRDLTFSRMTIPPYNFVALVRTILIPMSIMDVVTEEMGDVSEHVYSASQLSEAGLVFEVSESKLLLDMSYDDKGVLKMPCLHVDHTTESYMRNIIAYEECDISSLKHRFVSQYFIILDQLINTEKDVSILVDKKIIVNRLGDANEVATMVNNLRKNVTLPRFCERFKFICKRLNDFYENPMNKYKAIFVHEYFNTPWKIASTVAAVFLLLLTLIQTICSILSL